MYSSFQLAIKYIQYFLIASNGKGHGVHSPFVFDFIIHVLNDKKQYDCYRSVEPLRKALLQDNGIIEVEDMGAGSTVIKNNTRVISKIAASSLKPRKYAQLLFRIVKYYQPKTIVELGTSFGITTSYLASGSKDAVVYTLEGSGSIASMAAQQFEKQGLPNIRLIRGNFDQTLPGLLSSLQQTDLAFIDGNHRKKPTLEYFEQFLAASTPKSILILDDIHWSADMEEAWKEIQCHPAVTLTIDLFFIGLVFVNPDFKMKQHFKIRF